MTAFGGPKVVEFAGYRLDRGRRTVTARDGKVVDLKPKVFDTLAALAERPGELIDKAVLMNTVWPDVVVEENNLNQAISALRKALGDDEAGKRLIVTIPGRGYQFTPEVKEAPDEHNRAGHPSSVAGAPVLAVLAFDNLSGDPEMAFFSDGVSDEILQAVSLGLRTIGRASSFQFRGADKAISKVSAELGATHVLDGSVRKGGDVVRISAQLIESSSQTTIWQGQYDRPARDLFAVQDEIAVAVASALDCKLSPAPPTADIDPRTYEDFLRLNQGTRNMAIPWGSSRIDMADQITLRAPRFGRGWQEAAQARATARRNTLLSEAESRRLYEEMQMNVVRATELLGEDNPGLTALVVNWTPWTGAWTACEARLRRARERTPHSIPVTGTLASLFQHAGRVSEAMELYRDCHLREPLQAILRIAYGLCLNSLDQREEAYACFEAGCRRWPNLSFFWRNLVIWAARDGRWEIVERWTTLDHLAHYQKDAATVETVLRVVEMYRNPKDQRRGDLLKQLSDAVERTGRLRTNDLVEAAEFNDPDAVHDIVERATFAYLLDPLQGYDASDWGAQMLFSSGGKRLRESSRFVKLCARLGMVTHWIETGRWPDCARTTPYDFRAEAHRVASTPLG